MHIEAIVTDLDDTLLDSSASLSPYTLKIIGEAKKRGIRFIPASGRAAVSMRPFVDQLDTGLPYIACNGAQLMNTDHSEIWSSTLQPALAKALIRYFLSKGFYAQVYRGDYFYFAETCEQNIHYSRQTGMKGQAVGDLTAFLDFPTPKVLSIGTPEAVEALFPVIQQAFPEVSFTISKPYFLEAQPQGVTKGTAMKRLSELLGFSLGNTLAFGDSLNDVSMFECAPNSVAMRNARPDVIRAARYVTEKTNAQDGVAHFIEDHVLKQTAGA